MESNLHSILFSTEERESVLLEHRENLFSNLSQCVLWSRLCALHLKQLNRNKAFFCRKNYKGPRKLKSYEVIKSKLEMGSLHFRGSFKYKVNLAQTPLLVGKELLKSANELEML
jgi:hypothetical protein